MKSIERREFLSFPFFLPFVLSFSTTEREHYRCNRAEQITCYVVTVSSPRAECNSPFSLAAPFVYTLFVIRSFSATGREGRKRFSAETTTCDERKYNSTILLFDLIARCLYTRALCSVLCVRTQSKYFICDFRWNNPYSVSRLEK